jgi:AbrB family looped-hinge helix DNA binding protein
MEKLISTTKVTRRFQVTVPNEARKKLNIKEGDILAVYIEGQKIILKKT